MQQQQQQSLQAGRTDAAAFLRTLQAADAPGVQLGGTAGGTSLGRPATGGLLEKLRRDVSGPQLDELLSRRAAGGKAAQAAAACSDDGEAQPVDLQLPASPTLDDLLSGSMEVEVVPDSPASPLGQHPQPPPAAGGAAAPQVTPGFYSSHVSDTEEGAVSLGGGPGSEGPLPVAEEAIASLGHVAAFAAEAVRAVSRATEQAVRETGLATAALLHPPASLRAQSAATLRRPFSVPRKAGAADKENAAGAAGSKRPRLQQSPDATANPFSMFVCGK